MRTLREFVYVAWQYRRHGPVYALRMAWDIAVRGFDF